jgi:hypothetical protein
MEQYEAYLDKGRLFALDLDSGDKYRVVVGNRLVFSSRGDDDCPYEIFESEDGLMLINTDTGLTRDITLEKVEQDVE